MTIRCCLAVVVAVVGVAGAGEQAQMPPALLLGVREDPRQWGLGDHHEVDGWLGYLRVAGPLEHLRVQALGDLLGSGGRAG
jgi:hypothetical protein